MGNKLIKKCSNCRHFLKDVLCEIDGKEKPKNHHCKFFELEKEININPEIKKQIVQLFEIEDLVHINASLYNKIYTAFQALLSALKKQGAKEYGVQLTETQEIKEYGNQLTQIQETLNKTIGGKTEND